MGACSQTQFLYHINHFECDSHMHSHTQPLCVPCLALIQTYREYVAIKNVTVWPFEPICYAPHPLIRMGLEGPLPQSCNGLAALDQPHNHNCKPCSLRKPYHVTLLQPCSNFKQDLHHASDLVIEERCSTDGGHPEGR